MDVNCDYISYLPDDIKEKILAELSLKEAARTSILSSSWKDSWTSLPNLMFEEKSKESRLIELVNKVLLVHRGPIRKFKLVSRHACNEAIGRWMHVLSTSEIEHLHLECDDAYIMIPSRFFSCNALKSVCLSVFNINVPQFFNDFTLLHTLCLSHFNLSGFGIEKLVSSCPLLEHLELSYFVLQGCFRILAPKLTFLDINGNFQGICLETPKLVEGSIFHSGDYEELSMAKDGKESNITRALGRLSNIRKLEIRGLFLEYLALGPIPKNLPAMFNHLSKLSVGFINGPNEIAPALCLFQNAPKLKRTLYRGLWESKAIRDCLFKCLKVVKIKLLFFGKAESMLEFAKLVLSTAPLLEEFHVTDLGEEEIVVFEELKLFLSYQRNVNSFFVRILGDGAHGDGDEESDGDA